MVTSSERRCHLVNGIVIAKACANWTETLPSLKSRDTKTRTDIKNLLHTKVRYCSVVSESVVICQPTLKMAEEIDFENRDLGSGHRAYRRASLIDLYLHSAPPIRCFYSSTLCALQIVFTITITYQISSESEKLFVDGRTDVHLTHVIRSTLQSRPKK